MPLYDIRCDKCDGIFEKLMSLRDLNEELACPYCHEQTVAAPLLTGGQVFKVTEQWKPRNGAEQLAGMGVTGPGTHAGSARSSVLHNCKGFNCSLCKTG